MGLLQGHRKGLRAALLGTSALVGANVAALSPADAQSTWQGTTGDYGTASNWDNNTPPIASGTAQFEGGGVSTINVGTVITASGWIFTSTAQSYNIDGAALQFSNLGSAADSGTITIANTMLGVHIQKTGAGTLILTGTGSDLGGSDVVAVGGVLEIRGGSLANVGSVQIAGTAKLAVTQGGSLESNANFIGAGGAAEVTGAGSSWTTVGGLSLGVTGTGTLTVADGGTVTVPSSDSIEIGAGGTLKIGTGANAGTIVASQINNEGGIVANFTDTSTLALDITGTGTLTKAGSGTLVLDPTTTNSYTGDTFVTGGAVRMNGNGALGDQSNTARFSDGTTLQLNFSSAFSNSVNVTGNVNIDVTSGNIAYALGLITGPGGFTKTGTGTLALGNSDSGNPNDYAGPTNVNAGTLQIDTEYSLPETTDMTVNSGATLAVSNGIPYVDINSLADGPNGGGSVTIGNSSTLHIGWAGGKTTTFGGGITGDGSLSIDGGALTLTGVSSIDGDLIVCDCGELTIMGAGASFTVTGSAGFFGGTEVLGTLNVLNGAQFNTGDLVIEGTMTVSGAGTVATATGSLMGTDVIGMLNVLNGAKFNTTDLFVEGGMLVDGQNTVVTATGGTIVGPFFGFPTDPASLTISSGAVFNTQNGVVIEDPSGLTKPTVTVTGPGSVWNVSKTTFPDEALNVGGYFNGGIGSLMVSAGGTVNVTGGAVIGSDPSLDPATVTVTGAGSRLNVDDLFVGLSGCLCPLAGTLTVSDGGLVTVTSSMSIGLDSILYIGAGGLGGTVVAPIIANDGWIVANFTDVVTLAANISGAGTLTKQGPGTLFLTGLNSTYTGPTNVDGGKLVVNGSITSDVTVNAGGALGGNGSVGATTIMPGGTLSPGNSIGTITINGDLTFVGAGNYLVEVAPTGVVPTNDLTIVNGNANLAGTLTATGTGYGYKIGSRYTVLNTQGGGTVSGTFGTLAASGFGSAKPLAEYFPDHVDLVFVANALSLTGLTPNQRSAATAINTALQHGIQPLAFDVAFNSTLGLDLLSGEVHASTLGVLLDESLYPRQAVLGRLRQASYGGNTSMASLATGGPQAFATDGTAFDSAFAFAKSPIVRKAPLKAPAAQSDIVFWAQGFGAWGHFEGDGNATNVRRDLAGFFTGFDTRAGAAGRVGIAAGYTGSKYSLNGRGSATLDTGHVMAYGGWSFGALNLRAGGAFAHHSINTDRTIAIPGFFDRTFSSYAGYTGQVFGEAGYGFNMQGIALEAFAGAAWVRVHADGTRERGGDAALNVSASSFEVGYSTLGLRAATIVPLANSMVLVPRVTVAWQHAFGGTTAGVVNAFAAAPAIPFFIQGVPIARDSFLAEAGADVAINPQMTFGVSYTGQIARNVSDHGAKGKFSYRF